MEKTFKEVVEPKIRAKSVHLKTCTFTKIQFGEKVVWMLCNTCTLVSVKNSDEKGRTFVWDSDIQLFNSSVHLISGTVTVLLPPLSFLTLTWASSQWKKDDRGDTYISCHCQCHASGNSKKRHVCTSYRRKFQCFLRLVAWTAHNQPYMWGLFTSGL